MQLKKRNLSVISSGLPCALRYAPKNFQLITRHFGSEEVKFFSLDLQLFYIQSSVFMIANGS